MATEQITDDELLALHALAELRERLKAAPVVVPELTDEEVREAWYAVDADPEQVGDGYQLGVRHGYSLAVSRLRTVQPGEVVVNKARWDRITAEEMERPYLLELEQYVRIMARLEQWDDPTKYGPLKHLDALRSGEAGKDAIYGGEHAAAEIPAILAAHPGYTLPSSHDF